MVPLRFKDKVAVVTGAGRGIGKAAAVRLASEGASVFICSRTLKELEKTAGEIGGTGRNVQYRVADLGSPPSVRNLAAAVREKFGRVDFLINNASILGSRLPLSNFPLKDWEEILRINLTGTFLLTREILGLMIPRKTGTILNVSSSVGRRGRASWGAYAVSKFGVEGLTQVWADELRGFGIRVIAFNPGGTQTAMRAAAYPEEDPHTLPSPEDAAEAMIEVLLNENRYPSGGSYDGRKITGDMKEKTHP